MSDNRPPEGARWNIPDWKPFDDGTPPTAPPEPKPTQAASPATGIRVPITLKDFRAHWKDLALYAVQNDADLAIWDKYGVAVFTAEERARLEAGETVQFLLARLPEMYSQAASFSDSPFSVDLAVWEELHSKGLVSPHNLSRERLEQLQGIKVFDDALQAIPQPISLSVPLSLEEIQGHWGDLAQWCRARNRDSAKLLDDIEIVDPEKGTRNPWLTARQRTEIETSGYTYLDIQQVRRMYATGWQHHIPVDSWFALRERGVVSEHHLAEDAVRNLRSVPFFKELFDLKFNKALIYERSYQQELERQKKKFAKRIGAVVTLLGLAAVAGLGYGGWYYVLKPYQDLKADQSALLEAAGRVVAEKHAALDAVINTVQAEGGSRRAVVDVEEKRVAAAATVLPKFRTEPDHSRANKLGSEATKLLDIGQFEAAAKLLAEASIYWPHRIFIHNLAHAKSRTSDTMEAVQLTILALSMDQAGAKTGSWQTWRLLASLMAKDARIERAAAQDAYIVALFLSEDWSKACEKFLDDGRNGGDAVKKVVERVLSRLRKQPDGSPLPKTCTSPPAF